MRIAHDGDLITAGLHGHRSNSLLAGSDPRNGTRRFGSTLSLAVSRSVGYANFGRGRASGEVA